MPGRPSVTRRTGALRLVLRLLAVLSAQAAVPVCAAIAQENADCLSCHGETGGGDGFNAFNLDPRPRDISDPVFQKKKTDAELADAIQRGGAGVGLSALMPPWGKTLSRAEIEQIVLYIRSLKKS